MAIEIVSYLLLSASGFLAILKYFTMAHWSSYTNKYEDGMDVSWCFIFWMAIASLIPIASLSMNLFWFWVLRQKIKRRPLVKWPQLSFPKCNFPKCPIAVRGRRATKNN